MPGENNYNTILAPQEEMAFTLWANKNYPNKKIEDLTSDYDLRGAWKEIQQGKIEFDERGHLPDKYKKPNHITFSNESIYANRDNPGGRWFSVPAKDKTGKTIEVWNFEPSEQTLMIHGQRKLADYFKNYEPDSKLIIGNKPAPQESILFKFKK